MPVAAPDVRDFLPPLFLLAAGELLFLVAAGFFGVFFAAVGFFAAFLVAIFCSFDELMINGYGIFCLVLSTHR
jgi:hypothetical protein